jgi:tRNA threonylcarbamoyladenosine biosynthesis protein TsaE
VFHFDWYRLDSATELDRIGWDEYLDEGGIVVVEWAEKFPDFLPSSVILLRFSIEPGGSRLVAVSRP